MMLAFICMYFVHVAGFPMQPASPGTTIIQGNLNINTHMLYWLASEQQEFCEQSELVNNFLLNIIKFVLEIKKS